MGCREVVELVTDYIEGTLAPEDRARFERHLDGCPHCAAYIDQMRTTIRAAGRLGRTERAPDCPEELLTAFRDWRGGRLPE